MTGDDGSLRTWVRGTARASEPTTCRGRIRGKGHSRAPKEQAASLWTEPSLPLRGTQGPCSTSAGPWPVPLQRKCLCGLSEQSLHVPTLCHTHYFRLSFQPLPPQPAQVALVPLRPQFTDLKTEACRGWEAVGVQTPKRPPTLGCFRNYMRRDVPCPLQARPWGSETVPAQRAGPQHLAHSCVPEPGSGLAHKSHWLNHGMT